MRRTALYTLLVAMFLAPIGCKSNGNASQSPLSRIEHIVTKQPKVPEPPASAKFDFYVLTMSWSPEFCATHPTARECASHPGFIFHGLWPQNNDGTYPSDCGNTYLQHPEQYNDLTPDTGLLIHEWKKHGTCTGLAPTVYFDLARRAKKKLSLPPIITTIDKETPLQTNRIISRLQFSNPTFPQGSLVLSCGNNRLTAVEACFGKDLTPVSCGPEFHSCRAKVIRITPPNQSTPSE